MLRYSKTVCINRHAMIQGKPTSNSASVTHQACCTLLHTTLDQAYIGADSVPVLPAPCKRKHAWHKSPISMQPSALSAAIIPSK